MKNNIKNITIIGDGGWGTALALHFYKLTYNVKLWSAFEDYALLLKEKAENLKYLPGIKIPHGIDIIFKTNKAVENADMLVFAVPSKHMRLVTEKFNEYDLSDKYIVSVAKGIEEITFKRMSEVISENLNINNIAVLSGPTIAREVAENKPTAAVIASENKENGLFLQKVFNSDLFRIYTNLDVKGVEICGAVKNIIAIASGIAEGLDCGTNAKATLLTRAVAEMSRFGEEMGASSDTFSGLAGIGDLITTCFSPHSRNRTFGEKIAKGKKKEDILSSMDMVVEGVTTVKALHELGLSLNIDLPITKQVYEVLYNRKSPKKAVLELMNRDIKPE